MNKALSRVALLAVLLASSFTSYATTPAAQEPDRVALEAAIQRWIRAVNAQDAHTLTRTMTEDVQLLEANAASVTGRDAAIRALQKIAVRGKLVATSREITIVNDVAWHVVGLAQTQQKGGIHARGQALEIWKRVQGEWQLHRQMAAGVSSTGPSLTRPSTKEPVLDRPRN